MSTVLKSHHTGSISALTEVLLEQHKVRFMSEEPFSVWIRPE